jgi:hypothetical protein
LSGRTKPLPGSNVKDRSEDVAHKGGGLKTVRHAGPGGEQDKTHRYEGPAPPKAVPAMIVDDLEKQLVHLDLDIAKAKRYRREQKRELKSKTASKLDTSDVEKELKKTKQAMQACKATRKDIINQLLEAEATAKALASAR